MSRIIKKIRTIFWSLVSRIKKFESLDQLLEWHFKVWADPNHINREGLSLALRSVTTTTPVIVETGTSAYGTDSSRLFDSFVKYLAGSFYSVDIKNSPSKRLKIAMSKRTKFFIMDSLDFLSKLEFLTGHKKIDLVYLDSWDVDWMNPIQSALHGKSELLELRPYLKPGTVLIIDDTPCSLEWIPSEARVIATNFNDKYGVIPGKGAFFETALFGLKFRKLYHKYNLVIVFE